MSGNSKRKDRYIITMIIIAVCATIVNFGLFNLFKYVFPTYEGVEINMVFVLSVIGIVTVIMFILLPKDQVNEMVLMTHKEVITPEQELSNMIDEHEDMIKKEQDDNN